MIELRELRRATRADECVECGKCTSMCPLGTRADFSARRIANEDLNFELQGKGVGVGRWLTCASCEQRCQFCTLFGFLHNPIILQQKA